jgi:hypothetical protein
MAAARPSDLARSLSTSSRDPTGHGRSTAAAGEDEPQHSGTRALGHSVETELVALDVLHHKARLVVLIGKQQPHAYRAERGQALFTHEPGAGPHVKMQPVLDGLAPGNALEEQSRART